MESSIHNPNNPVNKAASATALELQRNADSRSATSLLASIFIKGDGDRQLRSPEHVRLEHGKHLLRTQVGRDFTLVTSAGVEFKIHSAMLIGGPKQLERGVFPEDSKATRPDNVTLPANYHPLFIDRLVCFLYTANYSLNKGKLTHLSHHTTLPAGVESEEVFALHDLTATQIHVCMYGMAEQLGYEDLKICAHGKLVEHFITRRKLGPVRLKELVDVAFEPATSVKRLCVDDEGVLKELAVAAVLIQERKCWSVEEKVEFRDSVAADTSVETWDAFRECFRVVKKQNEAIMQPRGGKKGKAEVEDMDCD